MNSTDKPKPAYFGQQDEGKAAATVSVPKPPAPSPREKAAPSWLDTLKANVHSELDPIHGAVDSVLSHTTDPIFEALGNLAYPAHEGEPVKERIDKVIESTTGINQETLPYMLEGGKAADATVTAVNALRQRFARDPRILAILDRVWPKTQTATREIKGLLPEARIPITEFRQPETSAVNYVGDESTLSPKRQIGGGATTAGGDIVGVPPNAPQLVLSDAAKQVGRSAPIVTGKPLEQVEVGFGGARQPLIVMRKDGTTTLWSGGRNVTEEYSDTLAQKLAGADERVQQTANTLLAEKKTPLRSTNTTVEWIDLATGETGSTPLPAAADRVPPGAMMKSFTGESARPVKTDVETELGKNAQLREVVQGTDVAAAETQGAGKPIKGSEELSIYWPEKAAEQNAASRLPVAVTRDATPEDAASYLLDLERYRKGELGGMGGTGYKKLPFATQQLLDQEESRLRGMLPEDFVRQVQARGQTAAGDDLVDVFGVPDPKQSKWIAAVGHMRPVDNVLRRNGFESVVAPIDEATRLGQQWRQGKLDAWANIIKGFNLRRGTPSAETVARLVDGQMVPTATQPELAASQQIRTLFNDVYSKLMADRPDKLGEVRYLTDYLPHIRQEYVKRGFSIDDADQVLRDLFPKELRSRFVKDRPDTNDYTLDLFTIVPAYLRGMQREIFDLPAYMDARGNLGKLGGKSEQGLWNLGEWYVNQFIGQPSARFLNNDTIRNVNRLIGDRIYDKAIAGNLRSAAINATQTLINTFPELGPTYTAIGGRDLLTTAGREKFHASGLLTDSHGLGAILDPNNSMVDRGRMALYGAFNAAEYVNRGVAYLGALAKARAQGMEGEAAERFAVDTVRKTQFTLGESSPIWGQRLLASIPGAGKFMQFGIKEGEFIHSVLYDGLKAVATDKLRTAEAKDAAAKAGRLLMMLSTSGALGYNAAGDLIGALTPQFGELAKLSEYARNVVTGKNRVEDIPEDLLRGMINFIPGSIGIKNATGQDPDQLLLGRESTGGVKEVKPLK